MRIITVTVFVAMSVACGGSGLPTTQPSAINAVDAGRSLVAVEKGTSATLTSSGRFKLIDGNCVFDSNDSGPDQCTPAIVIPGNPPSGGRFKGETGGTCVFVPNDAGPNQCTPAVVVPGNPPVGGRFKAGPGGTCVFVPNDAGPNQCTP